MNFWWVNHSQTFRAELSGGYIWSPKLMSNGRTTLGYENMTYVRPGDMIFSYADTEIKAVGLIEESVKDEPKPLEFGKAGQNWNSDGYLVEVEWNRLKNPIRIKEKIESIRHLLPAKYSPIRPSTGDGNQTFYLWAVSKELADCLLTLIAEQNEIAFDEIDALEFSVSDAQEISKLENSAVPNTERRQLLKSRIGQGLFRQRVIEIEKFCRITGVSDSRFLIASHIKPWKDSNNEERLDGNNGLMLSPHVDNLFDSGWISFSKTGDLMIGQSVQDIVRRWNISINNVGAFNGKQSTYLEFHRDVVFGHKLLKTVAAGIVEREGKILIAKRGKGLDFAGFWEFPGGKVESKESPQDCLVREFKEELSIQIEVGAYVGQSWLKKTGRNIHLVAFKCKFIKGDISLTVHDDYAWVGKNQFKDYKMAPADIPIVELL